MTQYEAKNHLLYKVGKMMSELKGVSKVEFHTEKPYLKVFLKDGSKLRVFDDRNIVEYDENELNDLANEGDGDNMW